MKVEKEKEEKKKQVKRDFKIVVASVVGTLLFVVILLLFVLFGLKKCNKGSSGPQSSNSSSMKYDYDVNKIDEVFKGIVKNQLFVDGFDDDALTDVISVTYCDSNSSFNLNIEVRSESKVYYYQLSNHPYTGYDNFIEYLFSLDLDTKLSLNDGDILLDTFIPTNEVVTLDKQCQYLVSLNDNGTIKYFSGYYFENNGYYIYQHQELTSNPLSGEATQVVGLDSPLYGYYRNLLSV